MVGCLLYAQQSPAPPPNAPPPHSNGESSSKDTKVSLAPPAGEEGVAPGKEAEESDIGEMHPWSPMKADKNVEIGDYYLTQKNYAAAISRYREALYWKPDDAMAHFRLGQALEAAGQYAEARKNYQGYLKILPQGKFASTARKALQRMKNKPDAPKRSEAALP